MLDIHHAKDRILRHLPKSHADYSLAAKSLTEIFGCLKHPQPDCLFKSEIDFKSALLGWKDKFSISQCHNTALETVLNLANVLDGKINALVQGIFWYCYN